MEALWHNTIKKYVPLAAKFNHMEVKNAKTETEKKTLALLPFNLVVFFVLAIMME
jgi:hypothetical protein